MSMELTKRLWEQPTDKGVLAYHIIQSFSPGEATPNQVHKIGCEFARRFLADRFECTVSTHLDKGHLHNHIMALKNAAQKAEQAQEKVQDITAKEER